MPGSERPKTEKVRINGESTFSRVVLTDGLDLIAIGGDLDPDTVLDAYRHGLFPWNGPDEPVHWWSPDPRAILPVGDMPISRRLARTLRQGRFRVTRNTAFERVMRQCADTRPPGWIYDEMVACYVTLHARGHAHSLEVWSNDDLVGGVYGVAIGGVFAAESMFHTQTDMSKVALVRLEAHLRERGFSMLDVQFETSHLQQFGCTLIPRTDYIEQVMRVRDAPIAF